MPQKLTWTTAQDTQIKRLRAEGASWDTIAAIMGCNRWTVIERGRRIGARVPPPGSIPQSEDPDRPPLPPGHAQTWGTIVRGSTIENDPYPYPVQQ